jgi:hypothetical protein
MITPESATIRKIWDRCVINPDGCFIWTGGCSRGGGKKSQCNPGYPSVYVSEEKTTRRGHVVIGEAFHGELPEDHEWSHQCGISICLNPDHIRPESKEENRRERVERHRRHGGSPWKRTARV